LSEFKIRISYSIDGSESKILEDKTNVDLSLAYMRDRFVIEKILESENLSNTAAYLVLDANWDQRNKAPNNAEEVKLYNISELTYWVNDVECVITT